MSRHEHQPIPQCGCAGGAGALLAHLRECGVQFYLGTSGPELFQMAHGFLTHSYHPATESLEAHQQELSAHAHRIMLLLVAELSGVN